MPEPWRIGQVSFKSYLPSKKMRELKQRRRRRLRKRHLKSEFALPQTLSRSFHLVQFVNSCQTFLELNSKGLYQSSGKEKESSRRMFPSSTKREIRHFHVVAVQRRLRNVQKSVMHVQSCCSANLCFFLPLSLPSPSSLLKLPIYLCRTGFVSSSVSASCRRVILVLIALPSTSTMSLVSPHVSESKTVLDSGFNFVGSGFQVLLSTSFSVELGFRIPIVSGIPDSYSCIPDSNAHDSGLHKQRFPRFRNPHAKFSKIPDST